MSLTDTIEAGVQGARQRTATVLKVSPARSLQQGWLTQFRRSTHHVSARRSARFAVCAVAVGKQRSDGNAAVFLMGD